MTIVSDGVSVAIPAVANSLTAGVGTMEYVAGSRVTGGTTLFATAAGIPVIAVENLQAVPEPGSLALLALAAVGLAAFSGRRRTT
jgi:hypothetical protein